MKVLEAASKAAPSGPFAAYLEMARIDALYDQPERRPETVPLYAKFVADHPDHPLAPQAQYMAALSALGQEAFEQARLHAEAFLANQAYQTHALVPAVLYIAAESYLLAAGPDGNPADVAKAEGLYRKLVADHPDHDRVPRALLRIGWYLQHTKQHDPAAVHLLAALVKLDDPAHKAEAHLLIGRARADMDGHAEAVKAFDEALKAKPDWPRLDEVLIASALSLREVGNPDEAAKRLERLLSEFADSTHRGHALYRLGEIAQAKKDYDGAAGRYDEVVKQFGDGEFAAPALYGLATAYYQKEQNDDAIGQLNALLTGDAEADVKARGHFLRGLVHQRLKAYDPAVTDLDAFLATNPEGDEELDARFARVLCLVGLARVDDARKGIDELLIKKPDYTHGDAMFYHLGYALLEAGDGDKAAEAFAALTEKFPDSSLAARSWFHIGQFHEKKSDGLEDETQKQAEVAKAAAAYAQGLGKAGAEAIGEKLQYKLGDMQFRQATYDQASATLLKQVSDHPDGELAGPGRFLAAEALYRQDKFPEAMPLFVQVAADKVGSYRAQALYRAGTCAVELKNPVEIRKHFEALLKDFSEFEQVAEARYGLARANHHENKFAEARALYEQVVAETETETAARAKFMIGEIDFEEGKFEDAIIHYLRVAGGYPYPEWQARARYQAGRCQQQLGNLPKAIEAFQKVVDDFPDSAQATDAAKLIQDLK